jgi:cytochrome c oxidase subunit 1
VPSSPPVSDFDVIPGVRSLEPMKDVRREIERRSSTPAKPPADAPVTAKTKATI